MNFYSLKEKPPKGYKWSVWRRERLTKIQATTIAENVWPEVWTKIGKAAQKREKQEWANEKHKLDNAQRLRGIHFIDQEDGNIKKSSRRETRLGGDASKKGRSDERWHERDKI